LRSILVSQITSAKRFSAQPQSTCYAIWDLVWRSYIFKLISVVACRLVKGCLFQALIFETKLQAVNITCASIQIIINARTIHICFTRILDSVLFAYKPSNHYTVPVQFKKVDVLTIYCLVVTICTIWFSTQ
jgi:hypothetical protein